MSNTQYTMKRVFIAKEFYHIFNRGIEKREIFREDGDRIRFLHDLYEFNDSNPALPYSGHPMSNMSKTRKRRMMLVNLHVFSLMPNHYHLILEQLQEKGITSFMRKLGDGYTKGLNTKYGRSGHLFQGPFKDVRIENDSQFGHLVCYIHANPLDIWKPDWKEKGLNESELKEALEFLEQYRWSSHLDYLGIKNFPSLITTDFLFKFFNGSEGYKKFFTDWLRQYEINIKNIQKFLLE